MSSWQRFISSIVVLMFTCSIIAGCDSSLLPEEDRPRPLLTTPALARATPSLSTGKNLTPADGQDRPAAAWRAPAFGILAVVPGTSGSTSAPEALDAVAQTGVTYLRISLDWAISGTEPGNLSFETLNDERISRIEAAGLRVFPTLYVGRGWMNNTPPAQGEGGSRSYPPDDLSASWNDEYGYSAGYYQFVYQFFSHYQGHFDYVAIENEAHSQLFWGGTEEEYVRLLKTAYKAIKAADPRVFVVDSGIVSVLLGICLIRDQLEQGQMSKDAALDFARLYYSADTAQVRVRSAADLDRALQNNRIQENCRRVNYMLENMGSAVDGVNFHYYENYQALPTVVEWLRAATSRAGYSPQIVSNELGMRGPDLKFAESQAHAQELFKKMVTAAILGLPVLIWFSNDSAVTAERDKVGIFTSTGELRPAGNALKMVIETLNGEVFYDNSPLQENGLIHHVFINKQGDRALEVVWQESAAQDGVSQFRLSAPEGAEYATLVDYTGNRKTVQLEGSEIILPLDDSPFVVIWR